MAHEIWSRTVLQRVQSSSPEPLLPSRSPRFLRQRNPARPSGRPAPSPTRVPTRPNDPRASSCSRAAPNSIYNYNVALILAFSSPSCAPVLRCIACHSSAPFVPFRTTPEHLLASLVHAATRPSPGCKLQSFRAQPRALQLPPCPAPWTAAPPRTSPPPRSARPAPNARGASKRQALIGQTPELSCQWDSPDTCHWQG